MQKGEEKPTAEVVKSAMATLLSFKVEEMELHLGSINNGVAMAQLLDSAARKAGVNLTPEVRRQLQLRPVAVGHGRQLLGIQLTLEVEGGSHR